MPSTDQADTLRLGEIVKQEVARVIGDLRFTGPGVKATRSVKCECEGVVLVISVSGYLEGDGL